MAQAKRKIKHIVLAGDWSVAGVADRLTSLQKQRPTAKGSGGGDELVIDVGGIDAIDACGCQLLALWLRHLRREGLAPRLANSNSELSCYIRLLGFAEELVTGAEPAGGAEAG